MSIRISVWGINLGRFINAQYSVNLQRNWNFMYKVRGLLNPKIKSSSVETGDFRAIHRNFTSIFCVRFGLSPLGHSHSYRVFFFLSEKSPLMRAYLCALRERSSRKSEEGDSEKRREGRRRTLLLNSGRVQEECKHNDIYHLQGHTETTKTRTELARMGKGESQLRQNAIRWMRTRLFPRHSHTFCDSSNFDHEKIAVLILLKFSTVPIFFVVNFHREEAKLQRKHSRTFSFCPSNCITFNSCRQHELVFRHIKWRQRRKWVEYEEKCGIDSKAETADCLITWVIKCWMELKWSHQCNWQTAKRFDIQIGNGKRETKTNPIGKVSTWEIILTIIWLWLSVTFRMTAIWTLMPDTLALWISAYLSSCEKFHFRKRVILTNTRVFC